MLTLSSQHALKALIHLIRNSDGGRVSGPQIARATGIPPKYLSAILRELVRAGILESARGKGGGFRLTRPARRINLYDVVLPFEPTLWAKRKCPFGNARCSDVDPCLAHDEWKRVLEGELLFLRSKSVHDVAVKGGRSAAARETKGARR